MSWNNIIPIDILIDAKTDRVHKEKRKKRKVKVKRIKKDKSNG